MGGQGQPGRLTGPSLEDRVKAVLDSHLPAGATVVVAVSGGPDSVALLHLVQGARTDLHLVVGHVRHGLRDDAADATAARANARAVSALFVESSAIMGSGRGPEDTVRRARYDTLLQMAAQHGASAVLIGHTMDDQAETVLLRISRGTGVSGLGAMAVASTLRGITILRPLLGERRDDIRTVAQGRPHVIDPTNTDPHQRRARARSEALPALRRLHPSQADVVPLLARLADHARQMTAGAASPAVATFARFGMAVCVRSDHPLTDSDLQGAAECLGQTWDGPLGTRRADQVQTLGVGQTLNLPGDWLLTRIGGAAEPRSYVLSCVDHPRLPEVTLVLDTPTQIPGHGCYVLQATSSITAGDNAQPVTLGIAPGVPATVTIRGRKPSGDRAARRILQRYPAPLRPHVPLVVASDDTLLMVGDVVVCAPPPGGPAVHLSMPDIQIPLRFDRQPG